MIMSASSRFFAKTEETGFEDPLGSNFNNFDNFDLVSFVGNDGEFAALDSPAAAAFVGGGAGHNTHPANFHHNHHHQQNLIHQHHQQQQQQQFNQAAAGLMIQYTAAANNPQQQQHHRGIVPATATALILNNNGGGGRPQLLDSPPITDAGMLSSGHSSASPSSGCCPSTEHSPFTPSAEQQQQQFQRFANNNNNNNGSAGMQLPPGMRVSLGGGGAGIPPQQQQQQSSPVDPQQHQMHLLVQRRQQPQQPQQHQRHPSLVRQHSDALSSSPEQPIQMQQQQPGGGHQFISPYPPSQSTPGSQVSPPSLLDQQQQHYQNNGGNGRQPQQTQYLGDASMNELYMAATAAAALQQQQHNQNRGGGGGGGGGPSPQQSHSTTPTGVLMPGGGVVGATAIVHQYQQIGAKRRRASSIVSLVGIAEDGGGAAEEDPNNNNSSVMMQHSGHGHQQQQHTPTGLDQQYHHHQLNQHQRQHQNNNMGGQQQQQLLLHPHHHQQLMLDCNVGNIVKREVPSGGGEVIGPGGMMMCSGVASHGSGSSLDSAAAMLNDNDCYSPMEDSMDPDCHHHPQRNRHNYSNNHSQLERHHMSGGSNGSANSGGSSGGPGIPASALQRFFNSGPEKENMNMMYEASGGGGFNSGGGPGSGGGLLSSRTPGPPHSQHSFDGGDYGSGCCYGDDGGYGSGPGGSQRTIRFTPYLAEQWTALFDSDRQELPPMVLGVVADKGFNYSGQDNCFVNQKKNHFQITVNIAVNPASAQTPTMGPGPTCMALTQADINTSNPFTPYYVAVVNPDSGALELLPVHDFTLHFCGAKSETPTSEIQIKQSQTDRRPVNYEPVRFTLDGELGAVKQTVPRLHFSETTMNNHRKNGKPNPEQKYFLLVVKLMANAIVAGGSDDSPGPVQTRPILVQAYQSERVIVRASNPGQFEQPETDIAWQKTPQGALAFQGQVAIGTLQPERDAQLTVMGDIVTSGNITRPSDRRVKEDITEHDTRDALDRLNQMRIVEYSYKPDIATRWGLTEDSRHRVGVIAQELAEVLPDAVRDNGEYLSVDDTRVFYETVAAAQELCRLTGNLECKINQVEQISQKLARITQWRKDQARLTGSTWSGISDFSAWMLGRRVGEAGEEAVEEEEEENEAEPKQANRNRRALLDGLGNGRDSASSYADREETRSCVTSMSSLAVTDPSPGDGGYAKLPPLSSGAKKNVRSRASAVAQKSNNNNKKSSKSGHQEDGGGGCDTPCCRHRAPGGYRAGVDAAMNTRLTQATVISLVVVMAFCLVAMCTLYVLDWYNRTYVYYPHPPYFPGPLPNGTIGPGFNQDWIVKYMQDQAKLNGKDVGKMVELLDTRWRPPEQPPSLQLSVVCGAASSSVTGIFLEQIAHLAVPLAAAIPRCPQYCCGARSHYEAFAQPQPLPAVAAPGVGSSPDPSSAEPEGATVMVPAPGPTTTTASITGSGLNGKSGGKNGLPPPPQAIASEVLVKLLDEWGVSETGSGGATGGNKKPRPLPIRITVPALGATIDEQYCVGESCDSRNGLYNLYVPVSAYMPPTSLELHISIEDDPLLRFVEGCGPLIGFNYKQCAAGGGTDPEEKSESNTTIASVKSTPSMYKVSPGVWELSVGQFIQSAYSFRVGHSPTSVLCRAGERQRGRTFDQYNLIFYRSCPNHQVVNPPAAQTGNAAEGNKNATVSTANIGVMA